MFVISDYHDNFQELHGFVGAVGLAGSVSGLYSVNGSNKQVIEKLIHYSGARVIRLVIFKQRVMMQCIFCSKAQLNL